jgi:hypothetical protein
VSTGLIAVERLRPDARRALDAALEQASAACPDGLITLCRARIRMLLTATVPADDAKVRAVGDYATSPLFSDVERLALEFTEQYVMDVSAMSEELVAELRNRLGTDGVYALAMGLYAIDQAERLDVSAAIHPGGTR